MNLFRRLGFTGRLVTIATLATIALIATIALVNIIQGWQQPASENRVLLPERASAAVDLLEQSDAKQRVLILKSLNSDTVAVNITTENQTDVDANQRLPAVEWVVKQYMSNPNLHEVIVTSPETRTSLLGRLGISRLRFFARQPLRIAIHLQSGEWVVIETRVEISPGIFGLPPGFLIGIIGVGVGILALLAIAREAKPLGELAKAVSDFGRDAGPRHVAPQGAPEFKALISAVNEMQQKIAGLLKGRTVLLGSVSHDLKTYIARLRMRVEDISNEAQQTKAINDLEEMTMLINDSLAIARGDAVSARREVIDIAGLLQKNIADRCNSAISFEQPPSSQQFRVRGDGVALKRLFDNIINNATQFATRVNTGLENVEENVVVYVDDDGPGIPAAERTAVFEPFYRLEQSRSRATGGSGLGLAIAGQIVDAHHGRIEIQRSPMGGARVAIFLPRAEAI